MNKKRKKTYKRILGIRGGFAPKTPIKVPKFLLTPLQKELNKIVSENTSPERITRFIGILIDKAAGGKSSTATKILKELSKPLSVKVGEGIAKLVNTPVGGVSAPEGSLVPIVNNLTWKQVSGRNNLYTVREQKVSFRAGNTSGRWIQNLTKTNGVTKTKDVDTTEQFKFGNATRDQLLHLIGAGQKAQMIFTPTYFGYKATEIASEFSLAGLDTSKIHEQKAYGAISSLISKMTVTSLNKYLPMYIKVHLVGLTNPYLSPSVAFTQCCNSSLVAQDNGAMPYLLQQELGVSDTFTTSVNVDPLSRGVFASDNFEANFMKIESRKVKLFAGDRLKISYEHLFGSGVSLDSLFSVLKESTNYSTDFPITYCLMLEVWGEEVDVYSIANPNQVIKATGPCSLQLEMTKERKGCQPLFTPGNVYNSGSFNGFLSESYAVKVYSKAPIRSSFRRWYGTWADLNTAPNGYRVPIMSDADERDAGSIT